MGRKDSPTITARFGGGSMSNLLPIKITQGYILNTKNKSIRIRICESILKNVPKQNQKYVRNQLDRLDKNFMDYICYWNEKYYRNGFCDGVELIGGCF